MLKPVYDVMTPRRLEVCTGEVTIRGAGASLADTLELSACITAELGDPWPAVPIAGAAETVRHLAGRPLRVLVAVLLERFLAPARAIAARQAWDAELAARRVLTWQHAAALLLEGVRLG